VGACRTHGTIVIGPEDFVAVRLDLLRRRGVYPRFPLVNNQENPEIKSVDEDHYLLAPPRGTLMMTCVPFPTVELTST
jgi:hypothetical protein